MNAPMESFEQRWTSSPEGFRVPYEVFTDRAYYDKEQEKIFGVQK